MRAAPRRHYARRCFGAARRPPSVIQEYQLVTNVSATPTFQASKHAALDCCLAR
jgi:hypothetical protein